jgi:hypothetical protein
MVKALFDANILVDHLTQPSQIAIRSAAGCTREPLSTGHARFVIPGFAEAL